MWCGADQPQHRHDSEYRGKRNGYVKGDGWIDLTRPGTERRMRDMRLAMVMGRDRLCCVEEQAAGCTHRQSGIEHDHRNGEGSEPTPHFVPSSTCRTSAIDSWLSQARGPTARPTA